MSSDLLGAFGDSETAQPDRSLAEEEEREDDWGDFEEADPVKDEHAPRSQMRKPSVTERPFVEHPDFAPPGDDFGEFENTDVLFDVEEESALQAVEAKSKPPIVSKQLPLQVHPSFLAEDAFDNWSPQEGKATDSMQTLTPSQNETKPTSSTTAAFRPSAVIAENLPPPPTNIPPPSILLTCGQSLMEGAVEAARNAAWIGGSAQLDELSHHLNHLRALGRILAGRKLRWKRDKFLSQSMKIGPAGRQGGMKLSGIDKGEMQREEQAAAELFMQWKQQNGAMRGSLVKLKDALVSRRIAVPNILAAVPVRSVGTGQGHRPEARACFLCGLLRGERVPSLDATVQDSFGEWWLEHWGHVDCYDFWQAKESTLLKR